MTEKAKLKYIDIARGICLILVVWAHANAPFYRFIYQFHMPFFFILSGYLHNSDKSFKDFFINKFKTLYIPFLFWNLLISFIKISIGRLSINHAYKLIPRIIFTLDKDGQFLGATWFLTSLFVMSVLYKFLESLLKNKNNYKMILTIIFSLLAFIGFSYNIPFTISRTLILGMFYALGSQLKSDGFDIEKHSNFYLAFTSLLLFIFIADKNSVNMGQNEYGNAAGFIIGSISITYFILYITYQLEKLKSDGWLAFNQLLINIGNRGVDLILWQFIGFWIIHAIQESDKHIPFIEFIAGKAIGSTGGLWWIAYFIGGLLFPLIFGYLLRLKPWGTLFKKMHIIN